MHDLVVFAAIGALGVLVQSSFGFASALLAVPLFALFLPLQQAIPAYKFVLVAMEIWLVFEARQHVQWRIVAQLLVGGCAGTPVGAYALKHLPVPVIQITVALVTAFFAVLFLFRIRIQLRDNLPTRLAIGLIGGVLSGSIAEPGPPLVIYGLSRDWDKNTFRTTLLCYFCCLSLVALGVYSQMSMISRDTILAAALALVPAFAASFIGVHFKNRVSEARFRQGVLALIIAISAVNLVHAVHRGLV